MLIVKTQRFNIEFEQILDFIAQDSLSRALSFQQELLNLVYQIVNFPLKNRQSPKTTNTNIRELIFKGYTIHYLVDEPNDQIIILGIFNQNNWEM